MKAKLLITLLFLSSLGFTQTTTLTLPNLKNEFAIKLELNDNDGINVTITDSENKEVSQNIIIKKDELTLSSLTSKIFEKINNSTTNYTFKLKADSSVILKMKSTALSHNDFVLAVIGLTEADFTKLVKLKTKYNNDPAKTPFSTYLTDVTTDNNDIEVFNGNTNLKFNRTNAGKIDLIDNGSPIITDVTTEEKFNTSFYNTYHINNSNNLALIKNTFFTVSEYDENKNIDFKNSVNEAKIEELYKVIADKNDYELIDNYDITTSLGSTKNYSVSIKNQFKENYFLLKFCDDNYNCKITAKMPYDVDKTAFKLKIKAFISTIDPTYTMSEEDLATLHAKIKNLNEKKLIEVNTKKDKEIIADLAEKIDNMETQYSGVLKLNNKIRVYKEGEKNEPKFVPLKDRFFEVTDTTYVRIFNNKIKDILIRGYLRGDEKDKGEIKFSVTNFGNSLPLRSLNNSTQYIPISPNDNDAEGLFLNVNDLFEYHNFISWNYSARNKEYILKPEKSVKIEQRKFMDYFTGVIFSDVLGLNNENPNAILQAELRLKVPIWIFNYRKFAIFHSLNIDVNKTLYSGFDNNNRYIQPLNADSITPDDIAFFKINNFDYIKYNNFNAGASINVINFEMKGLSTEWSFAYGIRYYRAGLRYTYTSTGEDVIKDYQLNALSHEISTNLEIRPQLNFGADINFAFNWLNARGATDNIPIQFNEDNNNDDKSVIRFQLNLYTKINPDTSNDGLYARLGGFYHLGAKDFFPQILVGYATNLSSFVNKFKK